MNSVRFTAARSRLSAATSARISVRRLCSARPVSADPGTSAENPAMCLNAVGRIRGCAGAP
jgi:hypothetical protein